MEKTKNISLYIIGVILLAVGIFAFYYQISIHKSEVILWLCYSNLLILGLACIFKKHKIIQTQLNIFTIPLLVWMADFLFVLTTKNSFLGITDYFFFSSRTTLESFITLQHLFVLPLAFIALYLIGKKSKTTWAISALELIGFFILTRILTTSNINCVYQACFKTPFNVPSDFYWLAWILATTIVALVTNWIIMKLPELELIE